MMTISKTKVLISVLIIASLITLAFGASDEDITDEKPINYENITVSKAKKIINEEEVEILDVRKRYNFSINHIEGALNLTITQLKENLLHNFKKDEKLLIYSKTDNKSATASKMLCKKGYSNVYNMKGGIEEWIDKGYPVKQEAKDIGLSIGDMAPNFIFYQNGKKVSLKDYTDNKVIIDFMSSNCNLCIDMIDTLKKVKEESSVVIITIGYKDSKLQQIKEQKEASWYFIGFQKVINQYKIEGYPTTFVLGEKNVILSKRLGTASAEEIMNDINKNPTNH